MLADCMTASRPAALAVPAVSEAATCQRVVALDVLRGFTMFWIIGGAELLINTMKCLYPEPAIIDALVKHTDHPVWDGFVAWDFVMPMFLFVVGAALPWAMAKRADAGGSLRPTYLRIARRVALLWVLGMLVQMVRYQLNSDRPLVPELYSNTLQAIAIGYLVTSLALLHLSLAEQIGLFAALVLSYGGILMFVPFPGHSGGTMQAAANFPLWVDQVVLGACRRDHCFTWVVSSIGFSATVLLGAMAGQVLRSRMVSHRKLLALVAIGLPCAAAGWVWSYWMPLNRHLWTSSMILWAGGLSFLVLAMSYAVLDLAGMRRWSFPFVIIGSNALLAYALDHVLDPWIARPLMTWAAPEMSVPSMRLCAAIIEVGSLWLICWALYRRRIFLRA